MTLTPEDGPHRVVFHYDEGNPAAMYAAMNEIDEAAPTVSWGQHFNLVIRRFLHRFGVHYPVATYDRDQNSGQWIKIGTFCWFC